MPFTIRNDPSYATVGRMAQQAGYAEALPKAISLQQQQQQLDLSRQQAAADHQSRMAAQFAKAKEARYRSAEQARQKQIQEKAAENKEYLDSVSKLKTELDPAKYEGEDAVEAAKLRNNLTGIVNDKLLNSGPGAGTRVKKAFTDFLGTVESSRILPKQKQMTAKEYVGKHGKVPLGVYNSLRMVDAEREGTEYMPLSPDLDQQNTFVSADTRGGVLNVEIDTEERQFKRDAEIAILKGRVAAKGELAKQRGLFVEAEKHDWKHQLTSDQVPERKKEARQDIREELEKKKEALEKALEEGPADTFRTHGADFDLDEIDAALGKERHDYITAQNIIDNPPTGDSQALGDANNLLNNSREKIGVLVARRKIAVAEEDLKNSSVARAALARLQANRDEELGLEGGRTQAESSREYSIQGRARRQSVEGDSNKSRDLAEAISKYRHDDMFVLLDDLDEDDEDYFKVRFTFIGPDGRKKTKVVEPEAAVRFMSGVNEETGQTFYEEQVERRNAQSPVVPERQQLVEELRRMQTLLEQWENDQLNEAGEQKMGLGARTQHSRRWALRNKIEETRRRIDEITPTR